MPRYGNQMQDVVNVTRQGCNNLVILKLKPLALTQQIFLVSNFAYTK